MITSSSPLPRPKMRKERPSDNFALRDCQMNLPNKKRFDVKSSCRVEGLHVREAASACGEWWRLPLLLVVVTAGCLCRVDRHVLLVQLLRPRCPAVLAVVLRRCRRPPPVHCSSRRRHRRHSLPPLAANADATTARCWRSPPTQTPPPTTSARLWPPCSWPPRARQRLAPETRSSSPKLAALILH